MRWKLFLCGVTYSHTAALCSDAHTAAQKHKHLSERDTFIHPLLCTHAHMLSHEHTKKPNEQLGAVRSPCIPSAHYGIQQHLFRESPSLSVCVCVFAKIAYPVSRLLTFLSSFFFHMPCYLCIVRNITFFCFLNKTSRFLFVILDFLSKVYAFLFFPNCSFGNGKCVYSIMQGKVETDR